MALQVKREDAVALFVQLGVATAGTWNDLRLTTQLAKMPSLVLPTTVITDPALNKVLEDIMAAVETASGFELLGGAAPTAPTTPPVTQVATSDIATKEQEKADKKAAADKEKADKKAVAEKAKADKKAAADKAKADKDAAKAAAAAAKAAPAPAPAAADPVQVPKSVAPGKGAAAVKAATKAANQATAKVADASVAADAGTVAPAKPTAMDAVVAAATAPKAAAAPAAPARPKQAWETPAPGVRPTNRSRTYLAAMLYKEYGLGVGVTDALTDEMDAIHPIKNKIQCRCELSYAWHIINSFVNGGTLAELKAELEAAKAHVDAQNAGAQ